MLLELPKNHAEEMELLKLADSLTTNQAACCILGIPPSLVSFDNLTGHPSWQSRAASSFPELPFHHLSTILGIIEAAIAAGSLTPLPSDDPMFEEARIRVEELKDWLASKNRKPEFFFGSQASAVPDYLDENHPRFSHQLNAAVKAWEAIQDEELRKGKSIKAAATGWLENNYRALGLVHKGERNNSAIERIAALINWEPTGGAPKTPE